MRRQRLRSWIVASSAKDARLPPTLLHADEVEQHLRPTRYAAGPSSFAVGIRANGRNPTGTEDGARGNALLRLVHRRRLRRFI